MKKLYFPKMGRGGQTARNLLLALVLATTVWGQLGFPLPTEEMTFRGMERRALLGRSEIVLHVPEQGAADAQFIGVGDGYAVTATVNKLRRHMGLEYYPLDSSQEANLVVTAGHLYAPGRGEAQIAMGVAALGAPEGVRAELVIWDDKEQSWEGHRQENGLWMFYVTGGKNSNWLKGLPYRLAVYGAEGEELLRQEGTVPEGR